jgi:carboxypeptidase C (cathepsin A)
LFGESYAGKLKYKYPLTFRFVPSIATTILANKNIFDVPLKGIGIADGITDPISIVREMPNYAFNMGLIDYQERAFGEKAALTGILLAN